MGAGLADVFDRHEGIVTSAFACSSSNVPHRASDSSLETPSRPSWVLSRLTEAVADIAVAAGRPLRAVDIGCGRGTVTAMAMAECETRPGASLTCVGMDLSEVALHRAYQRGVLAVQASVEGHGLPLASASVDVVIMFEVIEHLVNPDAALAEVRRVLVPGGHFLLSTPNLAAWFNRALLLIGVQPLFSEVSTTGIYGRPGHDVVGHLRLFTRRALAEFLVASGFIEVGIAGLPYHGVPRPLSPVDRWLCRVPSLASVLFASARVPE